MLVSPTSFSDFSLKKFFARKKLDCHITTLLNCRVLSWLNICVDVWTKLADPHPLGMWMWMFGRAYHIFIAMFENT
jgi:hypothetical protein